MATNYVPAVTPDGVLFEWDDFENYSVPNVDDEQLLYLVGLGDKEALCTLFERYSSLALGIGTKILRDRCEAEDLVQDIFLNLFRKSNSFDPQKGAARTWMVQFIHRRAFNRRVYLTRRHYYDNADESVLLRSAHGDGELEDKIATRLAGERLRQDLEQLAEKQRFTLELFFFEGYSLREISEQTGDPLQNTRHYYYRGIQNLKKQSASVTISTRKSRTVA